MSDAPPADERRAILGLWAGTAAAYADMYLTQPILPLLSAEFGVSPPRAGLTVSAVVLSIALASGFHGPLSDVLGRRRVMAGSLALLAVPTLLCALAPSFAALVGLRAAQGLLVPGMTAVSVAYAGDFFAPRRIPSAVGGIIAASVAGGFAGRLASGLVAARWGWRATCLAAAAWTLVAAALVARAPRGPADRGHAPGAGGDRTLAASVGGAAFVAAWRGMLGHLREPRLVGAFLVGLTLFFGWISIFTYLPYHLAAPPYRLSTSGIAWVFAVYLAGVVVSPLAGRAAARIEPRRLVGGGLVLATAASAATLAGPLAAVVAALVVFTVGTFAAQAVAPAFVNASARTAKGGASALYLTFYYLGGALGSWLPGHVYARAGWRGVVAVSCASLLAGVAANATLCGAPLRRGVAPRGP